MFYDVTLLCLMITKVLPISLQIYIYIYLYFSKIIKVTIQLIRVFKRIVNLNGKYICVYAYRKVHLFQLINWVTLILNIFVGSNQTSNSKSPSPPPHSSLLIIITIKSPAN